MLGPGLGLGLKVKIFGLGLVSCGLVNITDLTALYLSFIRIK